MFYQNAILRYAFFLLAFYSSVNAVGQKNSSPNILFIVVDDLGWSDLGCYGADLHETPNIDRLARQSFIFTNSYAAAPVCSPTRASILTGKYPARLNFTIWSEAAGHERRANPTTRSITPQTIENLPLNEITLAEELQKKGYHTAHIGKWHVGDLMHFPELQGFDLSVAASQRGAPPTYFYPYKGFAFGEERFVGNLGQDDHGHYFSDRDGEYLTDRLTSEAVKMIEDAGNKPLFLNLWYYNVHTPIEAKEADIKLFSAKKSPDLNHQNETYAAMVKAVDDNIGRILDKLEQLDKLNNTIIFLLSDNGGFVNNYRDNQVTNNAPLRSGKGSLYEGGIRIPTIAHIPQLKAEGKIVEQPISTIDFFPTILEILDINDSSPIDGKSFFSLLKNDESSPGDRALYWHYPHYYPTTTPVSAIRVGDWKLLEYLEDGKIELYNLKEDLSETTNLVDTHPLKKQELLDQLHQWKQNVNAQTISPNPDFKE